MKTVREVEEELELMINSNYEFDSFNEGGEKGRVIVTTDDIVLERSILVSDKYNYAISVDNDTGGKFRYLPYFNSVKAKRNLCPNI